MAMELPVKCVTIDFYKENPGDEACNPCPSNYITQHPATTSLSLCGM